MREHLNQWQAESLRLTTFHRVGSINLQSPDWWQRVTSDQPEQQISRPRDALVQQSGQFAGHQLSTNARPDRVDWVLHAVPDVSSDPSSEMPLLGMLSPVIDVFQPVYDKWLKMCEPTTRLACGAVLLQKVDDLHLAYEKLNTYLPNVNLDGITTPDFVYQVNRPSASTVIEGLRINKINKWSVAQSSSIAIALGSGGPIDVSMSSLGISCRLELDINTPAENSELFEPSVVPRLFGELIDFAVDIAKRGDSQ